MYVRDTGFLQKSVTSCTGKDVYVSMGYTKHDYFSQWFWYDISLSSTFQKNQAWILIVCSLYLNEPPFQHCISYFLLIPQKCLTYNSTNIFLKRKKKNLSVTLKDFQLFLPGRFITENIFFFKKKHRHFRSIYAQNQPLIWLRYAYLQWNPALPQHIVACIPLLLFHTRT